MYCVISSSSLWLRSRLNREMMGIMKIMGSLLASGARAGQSCPGQGVRKKHFPFHNPKSKIHILILDFHPFPMRHTSPSQTEVPLIESMYSVLNYIYSGSQAGQSCPGQSVRKNFFPQSTIHILVLHLHHHCWVKVKLVSL